MSLKTRQDLYQYGHPLGKPGPLKIRFFFWWFFFQNKNCWHFEFLMNQLFGQRFIIFEKLRYMDQLFLKLWAVEVAPSFH